MEHTPHTIKILRRTRKGFARGFTLIELVFVIAIFAIMTSVVLFNFKDFGAQADLDNLAQGVALGIEQAKKAAISGQLNAGITGLDDFDNAPSYGTYFSNDTAIISEALHQYIYFADNDHSKQYDLTVLPGVCASATTPDRCLSVTSMTTGDYISNICYDGLDTIFHCSLSSPTPRTVNITFTRPFPDATMMINDVSGSDQAQTTYIEITSGHDGQLKKTIVVTALGEVRVYNGCVLMAATGGSCLPPV